MKTLLLLLFSLCNTILLFSQKSKFDYVAAYNLQYPLGKMKNSEQFLLFMNSKENSSYFVATNSYVLDSLITTGRIGANDVMGQMKYDTAINESVINKGGNLSVLENIMGKKYLYNETPKIQWKIAQEKKQLNNITTRKAEAFAFGRKWTAWYAEDLPLNFAPYKFFGLPGLVYAIYDDKNEYLFTLNQFKKKNRVVTVPDITKIKPNTKIKIDQIRYNTKVYGTMQIMEFSSPKERDEWINNAKKMYKELPRLDITK